ncbi:MAG: Gfo/Idh/MocA family oxidoreductase [Planctomycetota bacterium]
MRKQPSDRRTFLKTAAAGVVVAGARLSLPTARADEKPAAALTKKIRVGLIGCGNVSDAYLTDLATRDYIELVSVCDIIVERAKAAAKRFKVPNHYPHIEKMLAGAPFDLLVNTTSMPAHFPLNKAALMSGKHVWSEKPMATEVAEGRELLALAKEKGLRLWAAPTVITSPQFRFMAETIASGKLGHVASARGEYGHTGPTWSEWFFQKGGGSLFDLGVYNVTTLTGLLGPAKAVVGLAGIITPERTINGKKIQVEAEDNAMMLIDHGNARFSHITTGFTHFSKEEHRDTTREYYTIDVVGDAGRMYLSGYDWGPHGVDLATAKNPKVEHCCPEPGDYTWQYGASYAANCLRTGQQGLITPEHGLHVLEVMNACKESQRNGTRVAIQSTFPWPIIK